MHLNRLRNRRTLAVATVLLLGTAAAACGSSKNNSSSDTTAATAATTAAAPETTVAAPETTTAATEAPTTAAPATTGAPAESSETVKTAQTSLGTVLVDGEGKTLYIFTPDNKGPSTCTGGCAQLWPAVAGPATAGTGATASMLATAKRPDNGSEQATYNGWPLYYFGGDTAAGQTNGQGIAGKWYVIDATGKPIDNS